MQVPAWSVSLLLTLLGLVPSLAATDDMFTERWQQARLDQLKGATLVISTQKTSFFLGETIPLQLAFTSIQPNTFQVDTRLYDRVGRMNYYEQFIIDPAASAEDPLRGLQGEYSGMGGISGGPMLLSAEPYAFERILNEWVRFLKPGRYRAYVLSHRVNKISPEPRGTPIQLVSNILSIEVRPAPAGWIREQLSDASRILDAPASNDEGAVKERTRAGRILRFLDTPEAGASLVKHLNAGQDGDSYALYMGVLGSPYRKQLLPLLEQRLVAPDQPVWDRYLDTLAQMSELVSLGPLPPYPKDEQAQPTWKAESQRRANLHEQKLDEYASRLFASLNSKKPQARSISVHTLSDLATRGSSPAPWRMRIVARLVADFSNLPVMMQRDTLDYRWSTIKGPAMLPILRVLYATPPTPRVDPPLEDLALRRLFDLSPAEARQKLLAELRHPTKNLRWSTLAMLPDETLPELNDVFLSGLVAHNLDEMLILRYASGDIVERVERVYLERNQDLDRQKLPHCGSPLVFYFLKYDPAFGERELRRNLSTANGVPACYDIGFQSLQLGRYAMSPALERLAIEYLASTSVPVKRGAAEILGKYGSTAAREPLWKTMEYFRSWWRGREDELKQPTNQEGAQFERALRIALAQADSWVLQEPELNRLLSLCSSEWCTQEVNEWLQSVKTPVQIGILPGADGFSFNTAQYTGLSAEQLQRKLLQYPPGAIFQVFPFADENRWPGLKEARQNAEQAVLQSGHKLAAN